MTTTGLVSIVMPTYNGTTYIDQAIQSCIDQTYPHWELVIVDDASTDQTPAFIQKWESRDARIRSIRHAENKGLPGGLNTGVRNMRGEFYTWLSDDDLFRPHALKTMVDFLNNAPDIDVVYTDYSYIDADGKFMQQIKVERPELLGIGNPTGVCHLRRTSIFDTVGLYSEDLFLAEDLDMWIRMFMHCRLASLHVDLFEYRQHQGSLTTQQRRRVYPVHAEILDRHREKMHWLSADDLSWAYIRLARTAFTVGDWLPGIKLAAKSFSLSPTFPIRKSFQRLFKRENTPNNGQPAKEISA